MYSQCNDAIVYNLAAKFFVGVSEHPMDIYLEKFFEPKM